MREHARRPLALLVAAGIGLTGLAVMPPATETTAAFTGATNNAGNAVAAAPDWLPPTTTAVVVQKAEGGITGFVRQGGGYRVYAASNDNPASNPPSGVASVTADSNTLTTGATASAMVAGPTVIGPTTYTHATGTLNVAAVKTAGTYAVSSTARDGVPANTAGALSTTAVVDNTAPASAVPVIVNGGTIRQADAGDTVALRWGEQMDPHSVIPGWSGASTIVTVRIDNLNPDRVTFWDATNLVQLPVGFVVLNAGQYVNANTTFGGPGATVRSSAVMSSVTPFRFTATLGTPSGPVVNQATTGTFVWTPSPGTYDRAGHPSSTTTRTEGGGADRDF